MSDPAKSRSPASGFRGVLQILAFNWTFYALGTFVLIVLLALTSRFAIPLGLRLVIYPVMGMTGFWMISSLLISHYVYDRSSLYQWIWLPSLFNRPPVHWANIHAGLDQTSGELARLFPDPSPRILDIYDASRMTEPSIKRARSRASGIRTVELADPSSLPLHDRECDAVFMIFAAHELRTRQGRHALLLEVSRSMKAGGQALLVEHLRDGANFLAYGPGAFHFHSRREWHASWTATGLELHKEISITPFVRCFVLICQAIRTQNS